MIELTGVTQLKSTFNHWVVALPSDTAVQYELEESVIRACFDSFSTKERRLAFMREQLMIE